MLRLKRQLSVSAIAVACALVAGAFTVHADRGRAARDDQGSQHPRKVFVIAMENHNWMQPGGPNTGSPQQIIMNPAAPFLNSLVNGTSGLSDQVAYAANYQNPAGVAVHPSEPNYVWAE